MNDKMLRVGVVIVSWNTRELTLRALRALFASAYAPEEVVLVDNASTDGSVSAIRDAFPTVRIIENTENVGFAKANNQGVAAFTSAVDAVWLLNSDTETGKNSLGDLVACLSGDSSLGAVGPTLVYPNGALQSAGGFFPTLLNIALFCIPVSVILPKKVRSMIPSIALFPQTLPTKGLSVDYATGAALLVRKSVWDKVSGLPTAYFMYFEETDMCFAIRRLGYDIRIFHTDPVMHVYGGSYKTKYDPRRLRQFFTSLKLFVNRNYTGMYRTLCLLEIAVLSPLAGFIKSLKRFV